MLAANDRARRNFAKFLKENHLSGRAISRAAGLSSSAASQFIQGNSRSPKIETLKALAKGAGDILQRSVSLGEILGEKDQPDRSAKPADAPETPIAHYVGAGDEVNLYDDAGSGMAIDYTPSPPGFERSRGAAAVVRGDSMRPIFDAGDLLFFRPPRPPPAAHDLPERAVIVQVRGKLFVKKLLPGTKPGRFHLLSINPLTPVMQDQPVQSYAFIEWVKPKVL